MFQHAFLPWSSVRCRQKQSCKVTTRNPTCGLQLSLLRGSMVPLQNVLQKCCKVTSFRFFGRNSVCWIATSKQVIVQFFLRSMLVFSRINPHSLLDGWMTHMSPIYCGHLLCCCLLWLNPSFWLWFPTVARLVYWWLLKRTLLLYMHSWRNRICLMVKPRVCCSNPPVMSNIKQHMFGSFDDELDAITWNPHVWSSNHIKFLCFLNIYIYIYTYITIYIYEHMFGM